MLEREPAETVRETGRVATDGATTVQSVRADGDLALGPKAGAKRQKPGVWTDDPAKAGTFDEAGDTWDDPEPPSHPATGQAIR